MKTRDTVLDAIGNTPLIMLQRASEETGCNILGKAEWMNPGQSVKDRAAKSLVLDAMEKGRIERGGTIVDGTAGNTGIGLTMVGNALGMETVIVIPETQTQEKKDTLRMLGAQLVEVPAVPYKNPNNYVKVAGRIAEQLAKQLGAGAMFADQFDNQANRQAHIDSTAPEIWEQTDGKVDGFICAVGTGGTLAGCASALRERRRDIQIGIVDPPGAALYSYFTTGELASEGSSITEGIGQGRITGNLEGLEVDHACRVEDQESLDVCFGLLEEEGLCLGLSSGINVAGAIRMAKEMGPGHTIVTILCDPGTRYQSRLFNPAFLKEKGYKVPDFLTRQVDLDVPFEPVTD